MAGFINIFQTKGEIHTFRIDSQGNKAIYDNWKLSGSLLKMLLILQK